MTHKEARERYRVVGQYIIDHPQDTYAEIATALNLHPALISMIARMAGVVRRPNAKRVKAGK